MMLEVCKATVAPGSGSSKAKSLRKARSPRPRAEPSVREMLWNSGPGSSGYAGRLSPGRSGNSRSATANQVFRIDLVFAELNQHTTGQRVCACTDPCVALQAVNHAFCQMRITLQAAHRNASPNRLPLLLMMNGRGRSFFSCLKHPQVERTHLC